jgi:hypothetical protein
MMTPAKATPAHITVSMIWQTLAQVVTEGFSVLTFLLQQQQQYVQMSRMIRVTKLI